MRRYAFPLFALAMLALPALPVPDFWITQAIYIGLYALVALGLVLLTGVAGLTSFGQAAFVGIAGEHVQAMTSKGIVAVAGDEINKGDVDRANEGARAQAIPVGLKVRSNSFQPST